MKNRYYKTSPNWKAIAKEVNRQLGTNHSPAYCSNVYNGNHSSAAVLQTIKDILGEK